MSFDIGSILYSVPDDGCDTLKEVLNYLSNYRHPLEDDIPIGCLVKMRVPKEHFVQHLMTHCDYDIYMAHGIADVVYSSPCEVIGINDLTDYDGSTKPFATIMDSGGCAYPVPCDMIKVFC